MRLALAGMIFGVFTAVGAQAQAPQSSPLPQARPAVPGAMAGFEASPQGLAPRPAPRPGQPPDLPVSTPEVAPAVALPAPGAQLPLSMIPQRPTVLAMRDRPRPRPAAMVERHAHALTLAPEQSRTPQRRSPGALQRHAAAVARAATAGRPVQTAAGGGGGQPSGRAGAGLCGVPTLEGRALSRITSRTAGCGIAEPVSVTAAGGVRLSQAATMDCDTARAFDRWVRTAMLPAMGRQGGGVRQIRVAAHYICRTRNHRVGARISEHGRGRAVDVSGFVLANGQTVTVLEGWHRGPYRDALRQMHRAACGIFRTTLGPGSDGMHEDHFHYDLAQRRSNYCR